MPLKQSQATVVTDKPTGAITQTFERRSQTAASAPTSGRLTLSAIYLTAGVTITSITFVTSGTALAGGAHGWAALFDPSRALLAQSVNDTAITWASFTAKTFTLTAPVVTTTAGFYYVGLSVVATTMPALASLTPSMGVPALTPSMGGASTTSLTTTAPATATDPSTNGPLIPYAYVS